MIRTGICFETRVWGMFMAMATMLALTAPKGLANTFTGDGNWNDGARWSSGIPADGDTVVIDGNVTNTSSTAVLASYTLNSGRTNTFRGTNTFLYATTVTINGTLTHDPNTATATNTLGHWIPDNLLQMVVANMTINAGGQINVDGKGFRNSSSAAGAGYGPGGGVGITAGGSYGGMGMFNGTSTTYGSSNAPADPGSGGGVESAGSSGGYGGGAVYIQAVGEVRVDGTVSANGIPGTTWGGSGGSGGSIYIKCGMFQGSGVVRALGGNGTEYRAGGGGGGGRIAVVYTNLAAQSASVPVAFSTAGGIANGGLFNGERGTLFFSSTKFFPTETLSGSYHFFIPGFTNWSPNNLTVANGSVRFVDGFQLRVTNSVVINNATLDLRDRALLECGGSLLVTNNSGLYLVGGLTNTAPLDNGLLVKVGGELRVTTNSHIYPFAHAMNGGAPFFSVRDLTVDLGGHIDANGKGYGTSTYLGPGGGTGWSGGGYGGRGGTDKFGVLGGGTYGSSNAPVDPGSAGSGNDLAPGGGAVRVLASGIVTINGAISANGTDGGYWTGGGSGGGIYINCRKFQGNGTINANGGVSTEGGPGYGGGGGGGRIAIWRTHHLWTGSNPSTDWVRGSLGDSGWGANGTIVIKDVQAKGTFLVVL